MPSVLLVFRISTASRCLSPDDALSRASSKEQAMPITLLDIILLFVMMISALLAMVRGFMREILSIAAWIGAAIAALVLSNRLTPSMKGFISNETAAKAAAIGVIFLATLLLVSIITTKISDMILDSRIGALDRTLGFLFGLARGLVILVVAYTFFSWLVPEPKQPEWIRLAKSQWILRESGERLKLAFQEVDTDGYFNKIFKRPRRDEQEPQDAPPGERSSVDPPATADAGYNRTDRRAIQNLLEPKPSKPR